jgi:hypothetical protein
MTTPSLSHVRLAKNICDGQLATSIDENLPLAESAPDVGNVFVLGRGPHQPGETAEDREFRRKQVERIGTGLVISEIFSGFQAPSQAA